jgi:predicted dehydrogenase
MGVIGLGNMGMFHSEYLLAGAIQRATLTAVADVSPARLERYEHVRTFTAPEDLLRSGLVDAVIIATPHYFHTTIGIEALEQGLHVLVEKPVSVHKADALELLAAHTNDAQVFAAMLNQRTDPCFRRIKKLLDDGDLGRLQRLQWTITDWFRTEAYYASSGWRATWRGEGGGVLLNQCPHQLDLLQWLCGMPARVRAFCAFGKYHQIEVEDEVTAYLEFEGGATGVFIASTGEAPGTNRLELAGDRGKLVLEGGKLTFARNETGTAEFSQSCAEPFARPSVSESELLFEEGRGKHQEVTQNFVDAILDGLPLIAPAAEGVSSVEIANAMLYSSLRDVTVELPLDALAYEELLNDLIANSSFVKRVSETGAADITQSFG